MARERYTFWNQTLITLRRITLSIHLTGKLDNSRTDNRESVFALSLDSPEVRLGEVTRWSLPVSAKPVSKVPPPKLCAGPSFRLREHFR